MHIKAAVYLNSPGECTPERIRFLAFASVIFEHQRYP